MFSKSKINDPIETDQDAKAQAASPASTAPVNQVKSPAVTSAGLRPATKSPAAASAPSPSAPPSGASVIGSDLKIIGNLETPGDLQIDGTVEGDIRASILTVGEGSVIRGEIIAEDVVVNGRVIGRLRGSKVRLSATAKVEGDILHKTIAIEAGANFEGSVKRSEDPLSSTSGSKPRVVDDAKGSDKTESTKKAAAN